jgi:hypothetical protein
MTKSSKPAPKYDYDAEVTRDGNPAVVTVKVDVTEAVPADKAISTIMRRSMKDEIYKRAGEFGLSGYGISEVSGYRAVTKGEGDDRVAVAYERDFKFTRTL